MHVVPINVLEHKKAVGAFFNAVVHGGENISMSVGPNGGVCTCRHSNTQVSRGSKWGFESERNSTMEAARSLLFIEVGECRAVVMAHVGPAVTKSGKV